MTPTRTIERLTTDLARAALLLGLAACGSNPVEGDPTGTERPPASFVVLALPDSAPPLYNDSVSFYAHNDRDTEGAIYFQEDQGERGDKLAELKIKAGGLVSLADGTPLGPHDSVLIVMKITNPKQLLVELSPSGIKFSQVNPTELKIDYSETGGDFNGDGHPEDEENHQIEQKLAIWRQEKPGDPYVKIATVKTEDARELEAKLTSFSRYAISY